MNRNWLEIMLMVVLLGVLMVAAVVVVDGAYGKTTTEDHWSIRAITECENNIPYEKAEVLGTDNYFNTGMTAVDIDTNGDGQVDVTALFNTDEGPALFWIVDKDYDGFADAVYIDPHGEGDCDHIVLYCEMGKQNCPMQGPMDWRA